MTEEKQRGVKLGLRAAATFLECTADDYDEMAKKRAELHEAAHFTAASGRAEVAALREKAQLLRGQAGQVRELKVEEGRRG